MKFVKYIVSVWIFTGVCLTSFAAAQSAGGWKWRFKTLKTISDAQSDEKTVFVAEYDGSVYAVNKQSGRKEWELKGGKENGYGIWLKRNVLIVIGGSGDGKIQAFAADTRRLLWSESIAAKDDATVFGVSENSVFKAESYNGLKALDLQTGKQRWINRDCQKISEVRFDGNLLYVLGDGGNLFALDAATGKTVWKYKRHGYFDLLANDDKALVFSYTNGGDKMLVAFEKSSGKQLWSENLDTNDGLFSVYETGRLYLTYFNSPTMLAFDTETGKQIWKVDLPDVQIEQDEYSSSNVFSAPTVVGDLLYSGGRDGFLYVFQKQTGRLLWKKKLAAGDLSSPLVAGDTGYLAARNKLFAVELKQGRALWQFSAYGAIYPLKYEDGTLYFQSQEGAYNAIDLKSIERLARLKKPLGTRAPAKDALDTIIPSIRTTYGKRERIDGIFSEPDIAENKAYFTVTNQTSEQGLLYEINLPNGAQRKVSEVKADELSTPKILHGRAYFSNAPFDEKSIRKPFLYGVEIESGKAVVARQIEPTPQFAPEIAAGMIFISGKDSNLYAYDLSGEFQWRIYADLLYYKQRFFSADGKSFYLRRSNKILSAFDFASGNVAWLFEKQKNEDGSIQTLSEPNEKTILVGVNHDALYNLDKADGHVVWKTAFTDDFFNHITLAAGGATTFVVTETVNRNWLQAIDTADGKVLWEKSVGSEENPAYLFGDDVCAADVNGFYCFKQVDGSRSVSYQTDKKFYGFSPNGILLYSTEDKRSNRLALQGVNLREGKVIWNINLRALGKAPNAAAAPKK